MENKDDNQFFEIIRMFRDYIDSINIVHQSEMAKKYCDNDQDALMKLYKDGDTND